MNSYYGKSISDVLDDQLDSLLPALLPHRKKLVCCILIQFIFFPRTALTLQRKFPFVDTYQHFGGNIVPPPTITAVDPHPHYVLPSTTGTNRTLQKPVSNALGVVLVSAEELGKGSIFKTYSAGLLLYRQRI